MLISYSNNFVFIKNRKCAGSSVEATLARFCGGAEDVITPLGPQDQYLQDITGIQAKNYLAETGERLFQGHASARHIRKKLGNVEWEAMKTFCVTRNPWARIVSQYCFRRVNWGISTPSFSDFVLGKEFTDEFLNYSAEGQVIVDHVLTVETLQEDLDGLAAELGLPDWDHWIPQANSGLSLHDGHYSEAYTKAMAAVVADVCSLEIEFMGYEFEGDYASARTLREPWPPTLGRDFPRDVPDHVMNCASGKELAFFPDTRALPEQMPYLSATELDSEYLQIETEGSGAISLNPSAAWVWSHCNGKTSIAELIDIIGKQVGIDRGNLSIDVLEALHLLFKKNLIDHDPNRVEEAACRQRLSLKRIPVMVISRPGNEQQQALICNKLEGLGIEFQIVKGVRTSPEWCGVALGHLKALTLPSLRPPFLILQDDCELLDDFPLIYDLPDDTDALCLGVSAWGSQQPGVLSKANVNHARFLSMNKRYFRVFNMLSMNAVLVVSERFHRSAAGSQLLALSNMQSGFTGGDCFAMLHMSHRVLTPAKPVILADQKLN